MPGTQNVCSWGSQHDSWIIFLHSGMPLLYHGEWWKRTSSCGNVHYVWLFQWMKVLWQRCWWNVLLTLINYLSEHTRHCALCSEWQKRTEVEWCVGIPFKFFFRTLRSAMVCFIYSAFFCIAVGVISANSLMNIYEHVFHTMILLLWASCSR